MVPLHLPLEVEIRLQAEETLSVAVSPDPLLTLTQPVGKTHLETWILAIRLIFLSNSLVAGHHSAPAKGEVFLDIL
jgi:hypothetical protein